MRLRSRLGLHDGAEVPSSTGNRRARLGRAQPPALARPPRQAFTDLTLSLVRCQATAFRTRSSTLYPVADKTLINRSVEIPCVFPFAMAVTRLRDVPALLAISACVREPLRMILISSQVSSERNSISPVSAGDKPRALPKSSAVLTRTGFSGFDCFIQHLLQSLPSEVNLANRRLLGLLLKGMEHDDRIRSAQAVENSDRQLFRSDPQLMDSLTNLSHRATKRHPQPHALLKIPQSLADPLSNRNRLCPDEIQCLWMEINRFHTIIMSRIGDMGKSIPREGFHLHSFSGSSAYVFSSPPQYRTSAAGRRQRIGISPRPSLAKTTFHWSISNSTLPPNRAP